MIKKIIWFLAIMFVSCNVKAVTPVVDYSLFEGIYSNRLSDSIHSGKMALITMNDDVVYCLEPFEFVGKTYYEDINYYNSISKENMIYFELVSYYGYNNTNRNNIYYYMAAQELIWERIIGDNKIFWSTGINGTGNRIDISNYKQEIKNNINNFYKKPSFDSLEYNIDFYEQLTINDDNEVLQYYDFTYAGDSVIKKSGNNLNITMFDEEKKEVNLFRKLKTNHSTIIYTGKGNQTLGLFGINLSNESKIYLKNIDDYYVNLSVTFYDKLTNELLNNIDFDICGDKKLLNTWKYVDKYIYDGRVYTGNYAVCELNGYTGENLEFEIKKDIKTKYINVDIYLTKDTVPVIDDDKPIIDNDDIQNNNDEIIDELEKSFNGILPNTNNLFLKYYLALLFVLITGIITYEKSSRN